LSTLSESQDAIVADPTKLDLASLTEEQLLLAAPLVPVHEAVEDCELATELVSELVQQDEFESKDDAEIERVVEDNAKLSTQRPFAALRDLMKKG
jgi:uncharacterized metal-binding protein YceD (DUF177 family)